MFGFVLLNSVLHSIDTAKVRDYPIRAWQEHHEEVSSVDWSNIRKDTFASSSWDGNVETGERRAL